MDQLKILWGAILTSTGLFLAMPLLVPDPTGQVAPSEPVILAIGAAGLAAPVMSLAWGRVVGVATAGHARWLPRWVLAESGAACGLVNHFLGGPPAVTWALCALAMLVVLIQFPRGNG